MASQLADADPGLHDYARQQAVIASFSRHALAGKSIELLFDEAARLVCDTLRVDHSLVMELLPGGEELGARAGVGWSGEAARAIVKQAGGRSHAGYALLVNAPVVASDLATESRFESPVLKRYGLNSGVAVVIEGREGPFGVLSAHDSRPREYSHDEVNFLQSIANILGLTIGQSRAEAELRASESYFRSLIEESSDLMTVFDLDGTIRFESPSIEKLAGFKAEELIGRNIFEFCHPDDREVLAAELRRVAEHGGDDRVIHVRLRDRNGAWRMMERKARMMVDRKGARCVVCNTRDVTLREQALEELRESERRFRGIFDASHDAIMITAGDDARVLDINHAFTRGYGYERAQVVGKKASELDFFTNPSDYHRLGRELVRRGAVTGFEADLRARDGRVVPTLCSAVIVDLGGGSWVLSTLHDITVRRQTESELARARDAALESARLKSAFLANTSHEIRTPLNVILGYADLVGEHLAGLGDHSQDSYLQAVERAGRRLLATIQQILDYSRLEAGAVELNPAAVALAPFIEDLAQDLSLLAIEKGLKLRVVIDEPCTVRFDEYCLQSALSNLVHNAIKFTDRGEIVLRLYRDDAGVLVLAVRDSGVGIDRDYLPKLFEPFSQEQAGNSRRFEGAGLGLALTRKYLELGGAHVAVQSRKGDGSTFTIEFPRACEIRRPPRPSATAETSTPAAGPPPDSDASGAPPRVLVVDDDPETLTFMHAILDGRFEVVAASSAEEVRAKLADAAAGARLILLSLGLRGESGLVLTRYLRAQAPWKNTPIVMLSGYAAPEDREAALEAGCDAFIAKPLSREALFASIRSLLGPR